MLKGIIYSILRFVLSLLFELFSGEVEKERKLYLVIGLLLLVSPVKYWLFSWWKSMLLLIGYVVFLCIVVSRNRVPSVEEKVNNTLSTIFRT